MLIRQLKKSDFEEYVALVDGFRSIGTNVSKGQFEEVYNNIFKNSIIYVVILNNEIIGSATLVIEHKFIHGLAKYGHIEDVIIKKEYRRGGYGRCLIKHIVGYCRTNSFYKITLSCAKELIPFYERNNFEVYQVHMSQLL